MCFGEVIEEVKSREKLMSPKTAVQSQEDLKVRERSIICCCFFISIDQSCILLTTVNSTSRNQMNATHLKMAFSILKAGSSRGILSFPGLIRSPGFLAAMTSTSAAPPTPAEAQQDFWKRNDQLKRPQSPWMIYKFQLTSMLSITHRATGMGLGVLLYAFGVNACLSNNTNWTRQLEWMHSVLPSWSLYSLKVIIATSLGYHFVNGIRHLLWDMGYGFSLKELYSSGYFVIGITVIMAVLAALNA
jgi:succinate dehydrogenase (ubiquinone) cytochrome b560 subunit